MKLQPLLLKLPALALLGALFASDQSAATQEPPRPAPENNADIEVQARGPIHEAFAQPGTQKPAPAPIVNKEVPPVIEEVPPEQKPEGVNVQWITGYWAWDDEAGRFVWVSGFWRDIPPGRQWVPGYWARLADGYQYVAGYWGVIGQQDNQYLPEPPETIDNGPSIEAPGADYSYVPGLWVYRETRYLWRPGYWLRNYENYCWTPASYCWTPSGFLYCSGFWDYPLLNRGLLFAPVCFNRPLWNNVGWAWQPNFCVQPNVFFGGLFCRSNFNRYYFGDYFGAGYAGRGFTPWYNNRIGGAFDSNFGYYRWQNRNNPRWEQNIQDVYARRGRGELERPGRTLAQQNGQFGNRPGDRDGPGGRPGDRDAFRPDNPNVLAPLARLDPNVAKLQQVSESRLKEERQANQELRGLSRQRETVETKLAEKGPPQKNETPRAAKLELPRTTVRDTMSAYPPNTVFKGGDKDGKNPGGDFKGGKGPDSPRVGSNPPNIGGPPKAPEGKSAENKPAPIINKQPDFKGPDNPRVGEGKSPGGFDKTPPRFGEGKQPGIADQKGQPDFKTPSVNPKTPEMKAPTPPPSTGRPDVRPLPELKAPTPPTGTIKGGDGNPLPTIRNPQPPPTGNPNPSPNPAPAIRNPQSPPVGNPTPNPAPVIRNPQSPPVGNPTPNPAPVIRNPQSPPVGNPTPNPAPVIRNPQPSNPPPSPAPVIRNPAPAPSAPPAIRNPAPSPAPVIRNPAPPPAPAPRISTPPPAPRISTPPPAPRISTPPPAPRPSAPPPVPRPAPRAAPPAPRPAPPAPKAAPAPRVAPQPKAAPAPAAKGGRR